MEQIKKVIGISFLLSFFLVMGILVIGLLSPAEKYVKPTYSNLEDVWFGAESSTRFDIPSYYDKNGNVNYTLFTDKAYGDMICRAIAFDNENYAGMKYFTISGPYQKNIMDGTINLGKWSGIIGETVVECALDPTK